VTTPAAALVFGPVPSRRLGRSLGVNNIPPKVCSYSCVYCQAGRTTRLEVERQSFYEPIAIEQAVRARLEQSAACGERIDYVTFVSDGEPTLDLGLGEAIDLIKRLRVRVAVVTNASLLWRQDVRNALAPADWVSLKVDAVRQVTWRRINRPHGRLAIDDVLWGQIDFARSYVGTLATETMIIAGVNDYAEELEAIADHVGALRPGTAWLSVPMRPPAEPWVRPPGARVLDRARDAFARRVARVGSLTTREPDEFSGTGDVARDLLAIAAVHPLREAAVAELLRRAGADRSVLEALVEQRRLLPVDYEGERFYRAAPP
jgi:wyosine [tRNA(Phe)-imidazoG37] synthetase (radical SAM superfamily)